MPGQTIPRLLSWLCSLSVLGLHARAGVASVWRGRREGGAPGRLGVWPVSICLSLLCFLSLCRGIFCLAQQTVNKLWHRMGQT